MLQAFMDFLGISVSWTWSTMQTISASTIIGYCAQGAVVLMIILAIILFDTFIRLFTGGR